MTAIDIPKVHDFNSLKFYIGIKENLGHSESARVNLYTTARYAKTE